MIDKKILIDSLIIPTFDEAMSLCNKYEDFFYKDETLDNGITIRSFNYRLSNYTMFTEKGARNLRGISFDLNTKELLALPLSKFFNFSENPFTEKELIETWKPIRYSSKMDGSLIIFFIAGNKLYCRTQNNSFSEQAQWAMDIVNNDQNLKDFIYNTINIHHQTVLAEFISIRNQVVVPYNEETLILLGSRDMNNGKLYHFDDIDINFKNCKKVETYSFNDISEILDICNQENSENFIEGFVIEYENGEMIKIKSIDYYNLHHLRDNILNEVIAVEMTLNGTLDDAKSRFSNDTMLFKMLNDIEEKTLKNYKIIVKICEDFYDNNKNLDKKTYAISLQKFSNEIGKYIFTIAIQMYIMGDKYDSKFTKEIFIKNQLWKKDI
jgi:T4 RnlA family RNA ligase